MNAIGARIDIKWIKNLQKTGQKKIMELNAYKANSLRGLCIILKWYYTPLTTGNKPKSEQCLRTRGAQALSSVLSEGEGLFVDQSSVWMDPDSDLCRPGRAMTQAESAERRPDITGRNMRLTLYIL